MKILKKGNKIPKYPEHRNLKCSECNSKLKADFTDCYLGESVLGNPNYYVKCPVCGNPICYCHWSEASEKILESQVRERSTI